MPKIYRNVDGKVVAVEANIQAYQRIEKNPYKRGFMLVRVRECATEDVDCLPLYDLLTIHHEALVTTDEGTFMAVFFTCQNSRESAYLELGGDTFPFAYLNYEEHKIWCAEFNEPAPSLDAYIEEALRGTKDKPTVNCFVRNPNGTAEFFNGIPATEETENRVNEFATIQDIEQAKQDAKELAEQGDYEQAIDDMVRVIGGQETLYAELNPEWKENNAQTAKLFKKLEKANRDWNDAIEDRLSGDFEESFEMIVEQSDLLEKIFEANQVETNEEEE